MRRELLDPVSRISEVLFGLLMALTFITTLNLVDAGPLQARAMFNAALGCNIAWGIVDAVMYLVRLRIERGHRHFMWQQIRAADAHTGHRLLSAELQAAQTFRLTPAEIETLRQRMLRAGHPATGAHLRSRDFAAALAVFAWVVCSTLPVALPFLIWPDLVLAMKISGALAVTMMVGSGAALGHYAGIPPWRAGLAMLALGASLVAATLVFGG